MTTPTNSPSTESVVTRPHGINRYGKGPDENDQPGKGCRCPICSTAKYRAVKKTRYRRALAGAPLSTDAEPVRQHVNKLRAAGLSVRTIAERANVPYTTLCPIIWGEPAAGVPPRERVLVRTANALLKVRIGFIPCDGLVPAIGIARRLQALSVTGWPPRALAERLPVNAKTIRKIQLGDTRRVEAPTAHAVIALYSVLWNASPLEAEVTRSAYTKETRRAQRYGWSRAADWDDDEIDNPDANPYRPTAEPRYLAIAENADELINGQRYQPEFAAERIGVSLNYLWHAQARAQTAVPDTRSASA